MGPFLILGLDKSADKRPIETHWADRLKWARRQLIKVPLEDINWAREELTEADERIKADAASLNADTTDGILAGLSQRFGMEGGQAAMWQPLDSEKALADYSPPAEVPDRRRDPRGDAVPDDPGRHAGSVSLLRQTGRNRPLDPWDSGIADCGNRPPSTDAA